MILFLKILIGITIGLLVFFIVKIKRQNKKIKKYLQKPTPKINRDWKQDARELLKEEGYTDDEINLILKE